MVPMSREKHRHHRLYTESGLEKTTTTTSGRLSWYQQGEPELALGLTKELQLCLGLWANAIGLADLLDGLVVHPGDKALSSEVGMRGFGMVDVALGECPSECHAYIVALVLDL